MQEGAPDIQVALFTAKEQQGCEGVDGDADGCHDGNGLSGHGLGRHQAVYRFIPDRSQGQQQDGGIEKGHQDSGLFIAVGIFFVGLDPEQADRHQGHGQAGYVRQVVTGIG